MSVLVDVRGGSIYLPVAAIETYFNGIEAVVVLIRERQLQILPVYQMSAGGCLLKIRNAAGDRVVSAQDVFAANDLSHWAENALTANWSADHGALLIDLPEVQ